MSTYSRNISQQKSIKLLHFTIASDYAVQVGTVFLVAIIFYIRGYSRLILPQLWAEDGVVFFQDAYNLPFWTSIAKSYRGYYHLLPRIIAEVATLFRLEFIPAIYVLAAFVVGVFCCSFFLKQTFAWIIPNVYQRALFCVLFSLMPANDEALLRFVNMQWYIGILCMLLVIMDVPTTYKGKIAYFLGWFIVAGTSPQAIIYIPCLIVKSIIDKRSRSASIIACAILLLLLGLVIRENILYAAPNEVRTQSDFLSLPLALINLFVLRVLFISWFGLVRSLSLPESVYELIYVLYLPFIVFQVYMIRHLWLRKHWHYLVLWVFLLYCIIAPIVLALLGRPELIRVSQHLEKIFGDERYYMLPIIALYLMILWCITFFAKRQQASFLISVLFVALLSLAITSDLFPIVTPDKQWALQVQRIKAAEARGVAGMVNIPINPSVEWSMRLDIKPMYLPKGNTILFTDQPTAGGFDKIDLEYAGGSSQAQDRMVRARGWALNPDKSSPAKMILIVDKSSRAVLAQTSVDLPRADVAASMNNSRLTTCGWDVLFPINTLAPGTHILQAYIFDPDTKEAILVPGEKAIDVPSV